ncbi:M50 family metallopeptidase [Rhodococcus sp. IEGM 1409]|uniref:M50 family metallopeptidase n=1 Tax=Rhodococcus sp. IEGM 1409 TaxID=3047082 RepID=UPI0024B85828|nr:M50 family metallopeptidase [Rhodococcus sp. IEGM 1409]MDI9901643.1 M50 family metallopeptidase [Rhodococcus sp. IEGM 1409]
MNALETAWDRVAALSPNPPAWVVQLAALIAVIIVLEPHLWRIARNVVTIAHEGAHLIVAVLVGRRLKGLRLHSDTSGVAISSGKPTGFGVILMTFAGYVGPSILGLGAAGLLGAQRAVSVLWIGVFVIAVMMVLIRNLYGIFSLAVVGAVLFGLVWWGTQEQQVAAAYFLTLFLLFAGPRPVVELQRQRMRRGGAPDSDADQLARLSPIPAIVWVGLFLLVNVAVLVLGGWWILRPVGG